MSLQRKIMAMKQLYIQLLVKGTKKGKGNIKALFRDLSVTLKM